MNEKMLKFENEKISKLLLTFSIPAIIAMIVNSLYNVIDRIFVGRYVNTDALSGIAITMPIGFIIMAFGMLIGTGAGALISIRLGQGRKEEAENILGNAFSLILIISIVLPAIFYTNIDWFLKIFGASTTILPYARSFITIILAGSFFGHVSFALSAVIRAEGSPRISMLTQLVNALLNIVLAYVFICLMGWGVVASALATVISQAVSAFWVLMFFRSKHSSLKIRWSAMKLKMPVILGIFSIGVSPFVMQIIASLINVIFNRQLSHYGNDVAIGAFGIINSIMLLILMPVFGIVQGSQPIIGYNYGAKLYSRVRKTVFGAVIGASIFCFFGWLIVMLFPTPILKIFTLDKALIQTGAQGVVIFQAMLFIVGAQIICGSFFQAIGKGMISLTLTISRQVIFLFPLLFILPHYYNLKGVWLAMPVSDILASIVTFSFFYWQMKKLKNPAGEVTVTS